MAKPHHNKLKSLLAQAKREGWAHMVRSEADERAVLNGCRYDSERAELVVDFFPSFLRHTKSEFASQPFELLDWQKDELIRPLFGWVWCNEKGVWVRRFTKAYVELPKKNGKSTTAAGIGLYMLTADGEQGAEIYSAATDQMQAGIVHGDAVKMAEGSPVLSGLLRINHSTKQITFDDTNSFYRALTATPRSNEGWDAHCLIADELHKWYGRELYQALRWAFAARSQPLFFQITTAGDDPLSICKEQHDYAKGVIDGTIHDDRFFALIYAADPTDDLMSEATWHKANPSLGVTITLKSFRDDAEEAARTPASWDAFKRYRLNIWTTGESVWLNSADWHQCREDFDPTELQGCRCWAGLDLAKTRDSTSLQLVFPWEGRFRLLSFFWLPEDTAREQSDRVTWLPWADAGFVTLTPGNVCDYSRVYADLVAIAERYQIEQILFDPYMAEQITQQLENQQGVQRLAFPQNIKNYASPTAEFERLILSRKLAHAGNPVMDWQIGHCKVYTDTNANKRPIKPKPEDIRKVDGVVAAVMALAGAIVPAEDTASAYDRPAEERVVFL